jgi:hypothetical protein
MRVFGVLFFVFIALSLSYAATYTFILSSGNWNVSTNWLPNGIPGSGDKAIIGSGRTVNINSTQAVDTVELKDFSTIGGSANLTISKHLIWSSGTFNGSGSGIIAVLGTAAGSGNSTHNISGTRELQIFGTALFDDMPLTLASTAGLTIKSTGQLTWHTTINRDLSGPSECQFSIESGGVFTKTGSAELNIKTTIEFGTGVINVNGGVLNMASFGTNSLINGILNVNAGTNLIFSSNGSNNKTNITGTTINGSGKLEVKGGIVNFGSGTNINLNDSLIISSGTANIIPGCFVNLMPKIIVSGGTIKDSIGITSKEVTLSNFGTYAGSGSPTINNGLFWTSGNFEGTGIIAVLGTIIGSGNSTHNLNGTKEMQIFGVASFDDMPLTLANTARLTIKSTGQLTWHTTINRDLSGPSACQFSIESGGIFTKTGNAELSLKPTLQFTSGTINVNDGILTFLSVGTNSYTSGTMNLNGSSKLIFSKAGGSPIHNVTGVSNIIGTGTLEFKGGVTNFESGTNVNVSNTIIVTNDGVLNVNSGSTISFKPNIRLLSGRLNDNIGIIASEVTIDYLPGGTIAGTYGGSGSPIFENGMNWKFGDFIGSGVVSIMGTSTGTLNSTHSIKNSKELHLIGNATFTDVPITMSENSKFIVKPTGHLTWTTTVNRDLSGPTACQFSIESGGIFIKNGSGVLNITAPLTNQGTIGGIGTITLPTTFTNAGTFSPGLSPGNLTLNKFSNANSKLIIEINGNGVNNKDSLNISTGTTILGGTLELDLTNGFVPTPSQIFYFMSFQNRLGTFSNIIKTGLPSPLYDWKILYNTNTVSAQYCPVWYADTDGDGFGDFNNNSKFINCIDLPPAGYVNNHGDCDDNNSSINSSAQEVCDAANLDEDCDGVSDDNDGTVTGKITWYQDNDADTYGNPSITDSKCEQPSGYVINDDDCNDNNSSIKPSGQEVCDVANVDEDCDGVSDDNDGTVTGKTTWYQDNDADTYGNPSITDSKCEQPSGYVINDDDCNDTNTSLYPTSPLVITSGAGMGFWTEVENWSCNIPDATTDSIVIEHNLYFNIPTHQQISNIKIKENVTLVIPVNTILTIGSPTQRKNIYIDANASLEVNFGGKLIIYGKIITAPGAQIVNGGMIEVKN